MEADRHRATEVSVLISINFLLSTAISSHWRFSLLRYFTLDARRLSKRIPLFALWGNNAKSGLNRSFGLM